MKTGGRGAEARCTTQHSTVHRTGPQQGVASPKCQECQGLENVVYIIRFDVLLLNRKYIHMFQTRDIN